MRPKVGDKFSSRHGQKGVVGTIVSQEDMPFSENGTSPDMIINPHAFPTRMTAGQIIEGVAAKAAALGGKAECDRPCPPEGAEPHAGFVGTPQAASLRGEAEEHDTEDGYLGRIGAVLRTHGYSGTGEETMTSGTTGAQLRARVMMAPIYMQRLMHMSGLKACARGADGPPDPLTRQPVNGLARGGGMKIGEMELQCLIAHGTMRVLEDRMFLHSDPCTIEVHRMSGLMPTPASRSESPHDLARVRVPYALKLLLQELAAMSIACKIELAQ
jgi:DNA-directed RNA polymerase III subunit RPC2